MRIGTYISARAHDSLDAVLERFRRAEAMGFATAWTGQLFDYDALSVLALAARETRSIELGSWVVPTFPRHPSALATQALTVQAASSGRHLLGIGVSHAAVIEKRLGIAYRRPLQHMREYLTVLRGLLAGKQVDYEGECYRVALRLEAVTAEPPPVLPAALGPQMLRLAGRSADGVAIWLGGPRYLEEFALPRVRAAASEVGRRVPRVVCGFPVAVTANPARGRASAEAFLAESARLPAYRRVLAREGAASPADVAIVGDESAVRRALERIAELGVDDLNAVLFPVEGDPDAVRRTAELLGESGGVSPSRLDPTRPN